MSHLQLKDIEKFGNRVRDLGDRLWISVIMPGTSVEGIDVGFSQDDKGNNKALFIRGNFIYLHDGLDILEIGLDEYDTGNILALEQADIELVSNHVGLRGVRTEYCAGVLDIMIRKGLPIDENSKPCSCKENCLCLTTFARDFWLKKNEKLNINALVDVQIQLIQLLDIDREGISKLFINGHFIFDAAFGLYAHLETTPCMCDVLPKESLSLLSLINGITHSMETGIEFIKAKWNKEGTLIETFYILGIEP